MKTDNDILVKIENLVMHFPIYRGVIRRQVGAVRAVDGVSLEIRQGETLGLVGDIRAVKPPSYAPSSSSTTTSGMYYKGTDCQMNGAEAPRCARPADDFPGPLSRLNPRMTVRDIIATTCLLSAKPTAKN
jgi:oligopeptide transport system ATP-binding protein